MARKPGPEQTVAERFSDKYKIDPDTGCWNWTGSLTRGGYGHLRWRKADGKWTMKRGSIVSYMLHKGPIPPGIYVCHKCDNPLCVNHEHLFLGTARDNAMDKVAKGRQHIIRTPGHRWLSKEIATNIRQDHKEGLSYKELEKKYSTSKSQISRIVLNQIWK